MKGILYSLLILAFAGVGRCDEVKQQWRGNQRSQSMKLSSQWKTLTQEQRRAWNAWAKNNPVLLDDGNVRRVSGHKAMTMVLRNRVLAGEAANPSVVPAPVVWLNGALNLVDAGPFTENLGYVGFRTAQVLAVETKWFVWASPPVEDGVPNLHRLLRFIKCFSVGATGDDELLPGINTEYLAVHGSWDGPGDEGEWPVDTFIWFRLHQYANGQLGPGVMLKGRIQIEL